MATIKDVARIAGVSVSTVSHVVNGTRYVSPEKVQKVEDAIRQLDELPNFIAKRSALKSKLSEWPPVGLHRGHTPAKWRYNPSALRFLPAFP